MKSRDFKTAEIAKFTKEEYDNYEESLKAYRDWKNTIDTAKKNSREEGREEGREEKAIEMAREMKAENEPIEKIMKYTKLTEEQINAL